MQKEADRLLKLPIYVFAQLDKLKAKEYAKGVDLIDLGMGNPDIPPPPQVIESLVESLKNPENQVSFALRWLYLQKTNWIKSYGMPQKKYDGFLKKLRDFIGHVKPEILVNDTDLLQKLFYLKERGLLRTVYDKVGKENFGKMIALYSPKDENAVANFIDFIQIPSEPEENDFIGYRNSLVIESQFDYFLNLLSEDTGAYEGWLFRDAPVELFDVIKRLLFTCIEKKYDMRSALLNAITYGYYEFASDLIDRVPSLIEALAKKENAVVDGIRPFIDDILGFTPSQKQVEFYFKRLNQDMSEILKTHLDLVVIFEPLKDVKTASAASIKKAQEAFYKAYPHINLGGGLFAIGANIDLKKLLLGVRWREDVKDIVALLRTKALEKNITINLSKYPEEAIEAAGLRDVFDGTYVSTRKSGSSTLFLDFASALSAMC